MELLIIRTYTPGGTNGMLYVNGRLLCYTIELPWTDNRPRRSCIPEGRYRLKSRYSPRHRHHLQVLEVPGRDLILIHPANDALRELAGCIATVSQLTGEGRGTLSRVALEWLLQLVYPALRQEAVFLTLKNKDNDTSQDPGGAPGGAHAPVL